jgi:hypothetical protein
VISNTGKTLPKNPGNLSKQSNVLPVFNITEQKVLVQSVYVKQVPFCHFSNPRPSEGEDFASIQAEIGGGACPQVPAALS